MTIARQPLTREEREELKRRRDRAVRDGLDADAAASFVRRALAKRAVSRERLHVSWAKVRLPAAALDAALDELGVLADGTGRLRLPAPASELAPTGVGPKGPTPVMPADVESYWAPAAAAELLDWTLAKVYDHLKRRKLAAVKLPSGAWRISSDVLEGLLVEQEREAAA